MKKLVSIIASAALVISTVPFESFEVGAAGKYQNVIVNGKNIGEIFCEYTGNDDFSVVSVNAELKKGSNEVTIEASWGWTAFDALLVEEGSFSSYTGGGKLSNPKASDQTQSLYNFLCDTYGNYVISGQQESTWMGSDNYEFDIIGADTYVNHTESLVTMYNKTAQVANKPVCLHENGPIPDPEKMKNDGAKWLWFMTWHTMFIDSNEYNTSSYISRIYNSDYLLTLDELPDIYHYGSASAGSDTAPAFEISKAEAVKGDVNADGVFNAADLLLMQKWMLGISDAELADRDAGDLKKDNTLNIYDSILMKQELIVAGDESPKTSTTVKTSEQTVTPVKAYTYDAAKQYAEYPWNYKDSISQAGTVVIMYASISTTVCRIFSVSDIFLKFSPNSPQTVKLSEAPH